MNEIVLGAQISNQVRAPIVPSRLPDHGVVTSVDLVEKRDEVASVFRGRQERFRALKNDHTCVKNLGYLFGALPSQKYLLCRAKAAVEVFLGGTHR